MMALFNWTTLFSASVAGRRPGCTATAVPPFSPPAPLPFANGDVVESGTPSPLVVPLHVTGCAALACSCCIVEPACRCVFLSSEALNATKSSRSAVRPTTTTAAISVQPKHKFIGSGKSACIGRVGGTSGATKTRDKFVTLRSNLSSTYVVSNSTTLGLWIPGVCVIQQTAVPRRTHFDNIWLDYRGSNTPEES